MWANPLYRQKVTISRLNSAKPILICKLMSAVHTSIIITARKRSLRRLCFHRCMSVHRGACMVGGVHGRKGRCGGACMHGGVHAWQGGHAWQGVCVARGHVWQRGVHYKGRACMAGGMHGRGHAWWGLCMAGGACVAGETATAAGGTHPTGMHSCLPC